MLYVKSKKSTWTTYLVRGKGRAIKVVIRFVCDEASIIPKAVALAKKRGWKTIVCLPDKCEGEYVDAFNLSMAKVEYEQGLSGFDLGLI